MNFYETFNCNVRFDGDIIITDPCYIMRKDEQYIHEVLGMKEKEHPNSHDYFSIEPKNRYNAPSEEDYPDYQDNPFYEPEPVFSDKTSELIYRCKNLLDSLDRLDGKVKETPEEKKKRHLSKAKKYSPTYQDEIVLWHKAIDEYYDYPSRDWDYIECGEEIDKIGINNSLITSTLYGDWSCITFEMDANDHPIGKLGNFCADAGLVGVFLLDEVLKYNPNFNYHTEKHWTTTLIKNFHGNVMVKRHVKTYKDEEDNVCTDEVAEVIGEGYVINGEGQQVPIKFCGTQCGF